MARLIFCLLLWAGSAAAQNWTFSVWDNGHLVHGVAASGHGLGLRCNGPSRGGLDAVTAEAHEDTRTPRGMMLVEIGTERMPTGNSAQRSDLIIWLSGTGYQMPPLSFNELDGVWQVQLPVSDPFFSALAQGSNVVLAPGQDPAWSFAADGLAASLEQTIALCEAAWAGQGPAFSLSESDLTLLAVQSVIAGCGGNYRDDGNAFLVGKIDNDDVPDVVVWWEQIQCTSGQISRPFCGASHCSAKVFLSSRAGKRPDDLLVQALKMVPLSNGRVGLSLFARLDSCGPNSLGCERIWYWDGARMSELQ